MSEVLSNDEIDQLLTAISSDNPDLDVGPVSGTRKIYVHDFKHSFTLKKNDLAPIAGLMNKICNYAQKNVKEKIRLKVSSVWQQYSEFFYEDAKDIAYIDQRYWLDDYMEFSANETFYKNYFKTEVSENYNEGEASLFTSKFTDDFFSSMQEILSVCNEQNENIEFRKNKVERNYKFLDTKNCSIYDVYENLGNQNHIEMLKNKKKCTSNELNIASVIVAVKVLFEENTEDESYVFLRLPESSVKRLLKIISNEKTSNDQSINIKDIPVTLECRIGSTRRPVSKVKSMGVGSIIELDNVIGEPSDIYANGVLIARGYLEVIDEFLAVRVEEIL